LLYELAKKYFTSKKMLKNRLKTIELIVIFQFEDNSLSALRGLKNQKKNEIKLIFTY